MEQPKKADKNGKQTGAGKNPAPVCFLFLQVWQRNEPRSGSVCRDQEMNSPFAVKALFDKITEIYISKKLPESQNP